MPVKVQKPQLMADADGVLGEAPVSRGEVGDVVVDWVKVFDSVQKHIMLLLIGKVVNPPMARIEKVNMQPRGVGFCKFMVSSQYVTWNKQSVAVGATVNEEHESGIGVILYPLLD